MLEIPINRNQPAPDLFGCRNLLGYHLGKRIRAELPLISVTPLQPIKIRIKTRIDL